MLVAGRWAVAYAILIRDAREDVDYVTPPSPDPKRFVGRTRISAADAIHLAQAGAAYT